MNFHCSLRSLHTDDDAAVAAGDSLITDIRGELIGGGNVEAVSSDVFSSNSIEFGSMIKMGAS